MNISIERTTKPKTKPDENSLGFGKLFTDNMFIMNYNTENGWHDARIVPYGPLMIDPSTSCLHYGQEVFEGLKAYRTQENKINLFRPLENIKRLNESNRRMCIPEINEDDALQAITELVNIDRDWVPHKDGTSLYIRPFVIGIDPFLGVHPSHSYMYIVILSPVGQYYPQGLDPVSIYVEDEYVRSSIGGVGTAKTGGNYAASLLAQDKAEKKGFTQVLWLDSKEHKYIEEVGAMNAFFVIGDEVVTPKLVGSILAGITRKSVVELLTAKGYTINERKIDIDELITANAKGLLKEAFGTGTAAVVSPIGCLHYKGQDIEINNGKIGDITQKMYDTLTGIQWGALPDEHKWTVQI